MTDSQDLSSGSTQGAGLNPAELLMLPDRQRTILTMMMRRQAALTLLEIAEQLNLSSEDVAAVMAELLQLGYVTAANDTYQVKLGRRTPRVQPKRQSPRVAAVWDKLG
ncbi:sigma factor-like helix-turn-helix DNA-binding protein [Thermosynechococcaceae cyanobacterium Okahandja]